MGGPAGSITVANFRCLLSPLLRSDRPCFVASKTGGLFSYGPQMRSFSGNGTILPVRTPVLGNHCETPRLIPVRKGRQAVGGRNPRVLQLIFEFFFDSLYGSIVISGFIGLGDEMKSTEGRQNLNRLRRYCRLGGFSFGEVGP